MKPTSLLLLSLFFAAGCVSQQQPAAKAAVQELQLRDYNPKSIFKIPVTQVLRAKFPVIDAHSHDYATTDAELHEWVATLDSVGVKKVHIMHCSWIGQTFEEVVAKYAPYKEKFAFWCCFDYTGFGEENWAARAVAQLEECHRQGAIGVGELVDKGLGDVYARPGSGEGIHMDDPRMKPLLERCGELGMPVSIHIAEPIWMYEPLDSLNDGLMNGASWAIDTTAKGCRGYEELMAAFERTLTAYPATTFIACHYLNMNQDLERLGAILDKHPNLHLDLAGRMGESAATPRATRKFLIRYADRVLYGTDNGLGKEMYRTTFRLLETDDEHIYIPDYGYHWAYGGFDLPNDVLQKIYHDNAAKLLHQ